MRGVPAGRCGRRLPAGAAGGACGADTSARGQRWGPRTLPARWACYQPPWQRPPLVPRPHPPPPPAPPRHDADGDAGGGNEAGGDLGFSLQPPRRAPPPPPPSPSRPRARLLVGGHQGRPAAARERAATSPGSWRPRSGGAPTCPQRNGGRAARLPWRAAVGGEDRRRLVRRPRPPLLPTAAGTGGGEPSRSGAVRDGGRPALLRAPPTVQHGRWAAAGGPLRRAASRGRRAAAVAAVAAAAAVADPAAATVSGAPRVQACGSRTDTASPPGRPPPTVYRWRPRSADRALQWVGPCVCRQRAGWRWR